MTSDSPAPEEAIRECLPCPFCGSDKIKDQYIRDGRAVGCISCGAHVQAFNPYAREAAIAAWNRRAGGEREYTREEMREACKQNYNAGRAAGWQPIETAPVDGTKIDVWVNHWKHPRRITDVYWSNIQGWWCIDGHYGPEEPTPLAIIPAPSHWQPLPAPPRAALAGQTEP